jgi:hypothetical protein
MGWNDRMDEWHVTNLPAEAFSDVRNPVEIDDEWIWKAPRSMQRDALKEWFLARYCDPAEETPYISAEGGYVFIHGGPYDPAEELFERFQVFVPTEVIEDVANELVSHVGDSWAPRVWEHDDQYDEDFGIEVFDPKSPLVSLEVRLNQIVELLSLDGPATAKLLAQQFAYSGIITALETYLWEVLTYAVDTDETAIENIITKLDHFSSQGMKLGNIFDKQKLLKGLVKGYLQDTVWHKWDKVAPLIAHGLRIKPPSFEPFEEPITKRHDIVHRSGHTKEGEKITLDHKEIDELLENVRNFAKQLELKLALRGVMGDSRTSTDLS